MQAASAGVLDLAYCTTTPLPEGALSAVAILFASAQAVGQLFPTL
jgi:hypothetical protein